MLRSALLSWVEMQLLDVKEEESLAWLKIIENILVTADQDKLETSTKGQWRCILGRCLALVGGCVEPCE
jgi:nucleolar pre-ribosomal-associated protein 1